MQRSPALVLFGFATAILTTDPARADDAERFHRLLDSEWTVRLAESPLLATYVGVHTSDDRLGAATEARVWHRDRGLCSLRRPAEAHWVNS